MLRPTGSSPRNKPDTTRYQPLVVVLVAVSSGIAADRVCGWPLFIWLSAATVAWLGWWCCWRKRRERWAMVALMLALAGVGGAWHHCRWHLFGPEDLGLFASKTAAPVCIEAIALNGPRRVPAPPPNAMRAIPVGDRTRVELQVTGIRDGDRWRLASGRSTLTVEGHLLDVRAGDRLQVLGQFNNVHPPENPGGFDFAAYARADRQLSVIWSNSRYITSVWPK